MRTRFFIVPLAVAALAGIAGCVTVPTGPSVMVLPGSQKPFEAFRADEAECRQYADSAIGGAGANQAATNAAVGSAIVGTLIGAAAGAAIGDSARAAGVGAGTGLLVGSAAGSNAYGANYYTSQRRYDNAYVQCMYGKGNQVPMRGQYRGAPPAYYGGPAPYDYPPPYPPPPRY